MIEIRNEYAKALFDLAQETQSQDAIGEGLKLLSGLVREDPEILDFLAAPNIPIKERTGALETALSGKVPEYVLSFAQLLCEHGQIRSLEACAREYDALLDASMGVVTAQVVSAVALTEAEKEALQNRLSARTGKRVRLDCSVDASLLGGLVVTLDGKVLDGSLKHRLNEVREVMNR